MSRVITERVEITDEMLKPSKRLIDANALMEDINKSLSEMTSIGVAVDGDWLWAKLNDAIEHAPTIEERKKGEWKPTDGASYQCSVCGRLSFYRTYYCAHCGADMT